MKPINLYPFGIFVCQQMFMEAANTYRSSVNYSKENSPVFDEIPFQLVDSSNEIRQDGEIRQDTIQTVRDSVPQIPTYARIRSRNWQHEKKLLVGGSRYIEAKKDVNLISSLEMEKGKFNLPIRERNNVNTDWLTIVLIIALMILASVRVSYSKYVQHLFQSLVNYSTSFRMFGEKNYSILHGAFRLELLFYVSLSIFLYQVIQHFQLQLLDERIPLFFSSVVIVIVYFFGKKLIYSTLGSVFEGVPETKEYLFNADNYNRSMGLMLFPVVALINYYPSNNPLYMVLLGIFIVVVFYIFLIQRGIYILLRKQFSIFYLFLYLCTLEFLPLLLLYKIIVL